MRRKYIFSGVLAIFIIMGGFLYAYYGGSNQQPDTISLAETLTTVLGASDGRPAFTPYYFENDFPPGGLVLDKESVTYSNDILLYSLVNPGGLTLTVTQQLLPPEFASSLLQGDDNFDTTSGPATVSLTSDGRATGSLVTEDNTLILVNTESAIELFTIKDVLRGFRQIQ